MLLYSKQWFFRGKIPIRDSTKCDIKNEKQEDKNAANGQQGSKIKLDKLKKANLGILTQFEKLRREKHDESQEKISKCVNEKGVLNCKDLKIFNYEEESILRSIKNGKDFNRVHYVDITFPSEKLAALIDTGASISLLGEGLFKRNYPNQKLINTNKKT